MLVLRDKLLLYTEKYRTTDVGASIRAAACQAAALLLNTLADLCMSSKQYTLISTVGGFW